MIYLYFFQTRQEKKSASGYNRPHSAYKAPQRTAGDMVEKVDMRVGDIIGQQSGLTGPDTHGQATSNKVNNISLNHALSKGGLTHYHIMPHFDAIKIYSCRKHCEKRRNCL